MSSRPAELSPLAMLSVLPSLPAWPFYSANQAGTACAKALRLSHFNRFENDSETNVVVLDSIGKIPSLITCNDC